MALKLQDSIPLWKLILRKNFTKMEGLADFLELSLEQRKQLSDNPSFVLNLPLRLAEKMKKGSIEDPLFLQWVPLKLEEEASAGFTPNPVKDELFQCQNKLLHKYQGRALILTTSACVMNCRYCFRQNFPYETGIKGFETELEAIRQDDSLHEVILSGGDPLSLSDEILDDLLQSLAAIRHVKRVRFHTRFPIGIPERIDESFVKMIQNFSKQIYMVLHINHPRELDQNLFHYLRPLQRTGCILMNQAVLLKGVNDSVEVLRELCETLADQGILPYYLHQLDRVSGSTHFEVSDEKGRRLIRELAAGLPGFAVPKFVREIPGEPNKTPL